MIIKSITRGKSKQMSVELCKEEAEGKMKERNKEDMGR
jgi:hypothetical protein